MERNDESDGSMKLTIKDCDTRRKAIEKELDDIAAELSSPVYLEVGLQKPLIDNNGFPIAGIDLHQVRSLRNRFAVLENDLKTVEVELLELLHALHENARLSGNIQRGERKSLVAFGKVSEVVEGSAADTAGLIVGDRIIRFGHLQTTTEEGAVACYDSIPSVVQSFPKDELLEIQVIRMGREQDEVVVLVDLKNGRLGCLIKKV